MPPKKQREDKTNKDIRSFFPKENQESPGRTFSSPKTNQRGNAETPSRTPFSMKTENGESRMERHSHRFTVKLSRAARKEFTIDCVQPCTVLEAIKSHLGPAVKDIKCPENVIIQLGRKDRESVVVSHFPCSCVGEGETLVISCQSERVEQPRKKINTVYDKDCYAVLYIDTIGGLKTRKKELFRSKLVKQYKYLCVYGEKGMAVEEALKQDGRFIDDLGDFTLSDNDNPDCVTVRTERVDNLHQKAFKICLPINKRESGETMKLLQTVASRRATSVKAATERAEKAGNTTEVEEIYKLLHEQFPDLKEWMEKRFSAESAKEKLRITPEKFGKIWQSFNEVHRVEKLLKAGKSVCKIIVGDRCMGTGFVLCDNLILTNGHLFKGCVDGKTLMGHIRVYALFHYEEPEPKTNYFWFETEMELIDIDFTKELDYAVVELRTDDRSNSHSGKNFKVPPGLLKRFRAQPDDGEACLLGHPGGAIKQMDPTWIIEVEKREQNVQAQLNQFTPDDQLIIMKQLKEQDIDNILMGGAREETTYNTYMHHGASGSPVFDSHIQLFGMHTAGFVYELKRDGVTIKDSLIEFAIPVLTIFQKFVCNLKRRGDEQMLGRIREGAKGNRRLEEILEVEPMDED